MRGADGAGAETQPPVGLRLSASILLPFAFGYFLSFFFRSMNAIIAPHLVAELGLSAGTLGLLTSAYFLAFALFQLPLGLLIDRYGPRRVQSGLLFIAAIGAALFASGRDGATLVTARALIGLGVSGSLMSAMTTIVLWFSPRRQPLLISGFLVAGGLGGLVATRPLELAMTVIEWRTLFFILAVATIAAASLIFGIVPDRRRITPPSSLAQQLIQLRLIYSNRYFWRLAPAAGFHIGFIFSLLGLWAAYWFSDVDRLPRTVVVDAMVAMVVSFTVGTLAIGVIADRIASHTRRLELALGLGIALFTMVAIAIAMRATRTAFWPFIVFAFLGNVTSVAFSLLPRRFPEAYAGRVLTALNIVGLAAAFLLQWLFGVILELWPRAPDGRYPAVAYQTALGLVSAAQLAALVVFPWTSRASASDET